jgi:hypothetical protein
VGLSCHRQGPPSGTPPTVHGRRAREECGSFIDLATGGWDQAYASLVRDEILGVGSRSCWSGSLAAIFNLNRGF